MPHAPTRPGRAAAPELPSVPVLPPNATVGRRWRFHRDLVIYLAHRRNGLSQRLLAEVFDLPRSRISTIIQDFPSRIGHPMDHPVVADREPDDRHG